jgi:hypothetical protein
MRAIRPGRVSVSAAGAPVSAFGFVLKLNKAMNHEAGMQGWEL